MDYGLILLSVLFLAGLSGYLLVWDAHSVTLTYLTTNFLESLPIWGHSLATFFMGGGIVTDFTLLRFLFLHLSIPTLMLFLLWWHYLRITRPVTNAPLVLNLIMFGGLLLACGLMPVGIEAPPNLAAPTGTFNVDWLFMLPQGLLANGSSMLLAWVVLLGIPIGMFFYPIFKRKSFGANTPKWFWTIAPVALCVTDDCPYEAIEMVDRDDDSRFKRLAIVTPERCANCGLCVGACAFKAIEIPRLNTELVLKDIQVALAGSMPS